MQTEKYKKLATDFMTLFGEGYVSPTNRVEEYHDLEYEAALCFALAMYLNWKYPKELEEAYVRACDNLQKFTAEVASKLHKDDTWDGSSITLL